MVNGKGQVAGSDWWSASAEQPSASIPAQVGDQLRGRTFTAPPAFEGAVWRAIGADQALLQQFDPINQRRVLSGFAPVAEKADWIGERRTFELRNEVGAALYDLDQLRIHRPASTAGVLTQVPTYEPWVVGGVALTFETAVIEGQPPRTWTPLAPPGEELLGPTVTPEGPALPGALPGETGATIPGFGDGVELPAPGLVNNEPAEDGEVGEYKGSGSTKYQG